MRGLESRFVFREACLNLVELPARIAHWWLGLSTWKQGIWTFAISVFLIELALRYLAPRSRVYARWTKGFEKVGAVWTAVILGLVYFLSVSVMNAGFRLLGKDPLDRKVSRGTSSWRRHEPNPLGPMAAARHQF